MNLLLDTHVLLWAFEGSSRLGRRATAEIVDPRNQVWVSAVNAWEIAIKYGLGRLDLPAPPEQSVPRTIEASGFSMLVVDLDHALAVAHLPPHHRDPFDRLLIAQATVENLMLVTADPVFAAYDIRVLPADR